MKSYRKDFIHLVETDVSQQQNRLPQNTNPCKIFWR